MLNENDLQELHLIAEQSKKELAQAAINRMRDKKTREEAQAKFDKQFGSDGEKAKATKTKADFKKGEFEIVGTAPNQMKKDAKGNLTRLSKKDTDSKELDIGSAKPSGGISNLLKKRREKTAALAAKGEGPNAYNKGGTDAARRAKKRVDAEVEMFLKLLQKQNQIDKLKV